MSHKQQNQLLKSILQGPISGNIHWREVESLLHHLGATIEPAHGARMRAVLNGVEGTLHKPHHGGVCEKHDVRHIREFLEAAGVQVPAQE